MYDGGRTTTPAPDPGAGVVVVRGALAARGVGVHAAAGAAGRVDVRVGRGVLARDGGRGLGALDGGRVRFVFARLAIVMVSRMNDRASPTRHHTPFGFLLALVTDFHSARWAAFAAGSFRASR